MIPPIWFLEINRVYAKLGRELQTQNETAEFESIIEAGIMSNSILEEEAVLMSLSVDDWAVAIEVTFLMLIIVARWILPKGKTSRSSLSQLLLVYLSLASDMIDLLSIFQEDKVINNMGMVYAILAIFSWSTFQFSMNLVATRGRNFQVEAEDLPVEIKEKLDENQLIPSESKYQKLCSGELPSIFITVLMQDLPFLVLRLIAVIHFKVQSYTTLFFTCKNSFILFLQFYRLWSISTENDEQNSEEK